MNRVLADLIRYNNYNILYGMIFFVKKHFKSLYIFFSAYSPGYGLLTFIYVDPCLLAAVCKRAKSNEEKSILTLNQNII